VSKIYDPGQVFGLSGHDDSGCHFHTTKSKKVGIFEEPDRVPTEAEFR
jgi:hypothetical protein